MDKDYFEIRFQPLEGIILLLLLIHTIQTFLCQECLSSSTYIHKPRSVFHNIRRPDISIVQERALTQALRLPVSLPIPAISQVSSL